MKGRKGTGGWGFGVGVGGDSNALGHETATLRRDISPVISRRNDSPSPAPARGHAWVGGHEL